MPIITNINNLTKQLTNQTTIDPTIISSTLGINIKLINSADPTQFFTGIVTELIPLIKNADTGIYTSIKLDGVDNKGLKKVLTITSNQLKSNVYGNGYDKMYYTSKLQNTLSPSIKEESVDDVVVDDASIYVFDSEYAVLGNLVSYKKNGDSQVVNGIISGVDAKSDNIKVTTFIGGKLITVTLTLVEATASGFEGYVVGSAIN